MEKRNVRIESADYIADEIKLLRIVPVDGVPLPPFEPGSHIDLYISPGLVRQYSLCGLNDERGYAVAVKLELESRGGSRAVHETLRPGEVIQISLPRNNFQLSSEGGESILLAGGIGITPLISMARFLASADRPVHLLYFSRSEKHAAFRQELEQGPLAAMSQFFYGLDRDHVATVIEQTFSDAADGAHVYTCGPRPFMDMVVELALKRGFREDNVHLEYFVAAQPLEQLTEGGAFEVELARSGITVPIASGQTIIDVIRAQGIDIETSCEAGVCGTCVTRVLEGTPDHRDSFLSRAEHERGDCMAICVSRSRTARLVLDL